ncbi:MAG: tetratricopeptide repeat protein [Saprospiraceae bacterium]
MIRYFFILFIICSLFACNTSEKETVSTTTPSNSTKNSHRLATTASKKGAWLEAAQLYEEIYQQDLSNESANYETGTNYLKANYPHKALTILTGFDKKHQDKSAEFNGRIARIAKAYYQLRQYHAILQVVENYNYPKMYRGLAREHLKTLIQLEQPTVLAKQFSIYQQTGIYDDKGKSTNMGFLYRAICNELLLTNQLELLKTYANQYSDWATKRLAKDKRNAAFAAFYQQNYPQTIDKIKAAIDVEKSGRHLMELEGLLGVCYAKNQNLRKAIAQIQKIQAMDDLPPRHDAFGAKFYHQARIKVALGQPKDAIKSLKKGLANKAEFWSNRFREDGLMRDIFEEDGFKILVQYRY